MIIVGKQGKNESEIRNERKWVRQGGGTEGGISIGSDKGAR